MQPVAWQVWDIVPRLNERRHATADRRVRREVVPFADRRREERRTLNARPPALLRGTYAHGWLCFDNGAQKRRLSPIPGDWVTCDDERIRTYLYSAAPVPGASGRMLEDGHDDSLARAG